MPEGKKEYLYSVYQGPLGNEALKEKAREIGAKIKFDREVGAYELVTEGLAKKYVTALKAGVSDLVGKEAKAREAAERTELPAARHSLRAARRTRAGHINTRKQK